MTLLVFDSGIGGLSVAREVSGLQPQTPMMYLADNAGFPYGETPDGELAARIVALISQAVQRLRPRAVVLACNTASTIALAPLRAALKIPVIGCVPPVKPAAAASRLRRIGLLATPATIRRPYLQALIDEFAAGCAVVPLGSNQLAALAEAKFLGQPVSQHQLATIVAPLFAPPGIDAVALGCTHYSFLLPELRALQPRMGFFDPALAVAKQALKVAPPWPPAPPGLAGTAFFTQPPPAGMAACLGLFGFNKIELFAGGAA